MSFGLKDRRSNDRRPPGLDDAALIVGARRVPCVCVNVSPGGAGLRLPADVLVPQNCRLQIEGRTRTIEVVWRTEDRVGVRFLD